MGDPEKAKAYLRSYPGHVLNKYSAIATGQYLFYGGLGVNRLVNVKWKTDLNAFKEADEALPNVSAMVEKDKIDDFMEAGLDMQADYFNKMFARNSYISGVFLMQAYQQKLLVEKINRRKALLSLREDSLDDTVKKSGASARKKKK